MSSEQPKTIFDFPVNNARGEPYDMSQHRGQVVMIMNVASQCGYTQSDYDTANELHAKYKEQGFAVLAFPCNQFGGQEPGTAEEVEATVCKRLKVSYPLLEKVEVNGKGAHPLWQFMCTSVPGILGTTSVKWNFTRFLIDRNGVPVARHAPNSKTPAVEKDLVKLL